MNLPGKGIQTRDCSFKAQPSCRDERVARVLPDPDPVRQEVPIAVEADEPEVRGVRDGVG